MTGKGQDEREDFAASVREVCNEWVHESGFGPTSDWHVTRLLPLADRLDAALVESEARDRELEAMLRCSEEHTQFHEAREAVLVEALRKIGDGQAKPHLIARSALAGVVEAEPERKDADA